MGNVAVKETSEIPEDERAAVLGGGTPDLEAIAKLIRDGNARNIVAVCGAGISVSAGIPDFRTPGTGLYDNLQKYDLPEGRPESVFELEYFQTKPAAFYRLAKELYPGQYKPTPCHHFLKLLHSKGVLRRIYTQNIDSLERLADLPEDIVVPCHGNFDNAHCIVCGEDVDINFVREEIFQDREPRCPQDGCDGLCKPKIVFFGESLVPKFAECRVQDFCAEVDTRSPEEKAAWVERRQELSRLDIQVTLGAYDREKLKREKEEHAQEAKDKMTVSCACDLLLVFGTSLKVAPVSSLPDEVHWLCPRVLFNREAVHLHGEEQGDVWPPRTGGDNGFRFNMRDNYRDVFCQMDCDEAVTEFAKLLGWSDELHKLIRS
eukprot:gene28565-35425_t